MDKTKDIYIGVAVALLVIFGVFFKDSLGLGELTSSARPTTDTVSDTKSDLVSPTFDIPNISGVSVGLQAWSTFEEYIKFAKAHDINGIKSLSYQLSPACLDPQKMSECIELMDSVVFFTEGWKQSDFVNVAYDEKQIVLSTNYIQKAEGEDGVKTVLYFVRGDAGEPKLLSIRFCLGDDKATYTCVETDPAKRDKDGNGWWDDVETFFRK